MKSLNRTLSLVLVLVMVFGLFGVASATSSTYTDSTTVGAAYVEAVDVLTGIGVVNGTTSTTLEPTGNYTREQAAKVICYLTLGKTTADALACSTAPFTDVAASRWSAGYIQYCVSQGIINGMGDGTFAPEANLTGYQFAKMLLGALGYGKSNEYVGSGWEIAVAKEALGLKIFAGDTAAATNANITRQQAMLMACNTMFLATVKAKYAYDNGVKYVSEYTTGGDSFAKTIYGYSGVASATPSATGLSKVNTTVNGAGGYVWYYKDTTTPISALVSSDVVIGSSSAGTTLATLATYSTTNAKYIASLATSGVEFYIDGAPAAYALTADVALNAAKIYFTRSGAGTVADPYVYSKVDAPVVGNIGTYYEPAGVYAAIGNGVLVNLIDSNETPKTAEKVSITTYELCVVNAAPVVKNNTADGKDYVAIDMSTGTDIGGGAVINYSVKASKVAGYTGLAKGDVVLVYAYNDGTYKIVKAETFTAQVSATTATTLTIGGTAYKFSAAADASITGYSLGYMKDVVFFKDTYGYLVYAKATTTATTNYLMVLEKGTFLSGVLTGDTNKASVVFDDGTTGVITITAVDTHTWAAATLVAGDVSNNTAYSYAKLSDGTYALVSAGANFVAGNDAITKGVATSIGGDITSDANTVFVMINKSGATYLKTWTVTKGYANFSGFATAANFSAIKGVDGMADVVFVYTYAASTAADTGVFYLLDTTPTAVYKAGGLLDYYTFPALVNGVVTTVKSTSADITRVAAGNTDGLAMNYALVPAILNSATFAGDAVAAAAASPATLAVGQLCFATFTDGYITPGSVLPLTTTTEAIANAVGGATCFDVDTAIGTPANDVVTIGSVAYSYTPTTVVFYISADHQTVTPNVMSSVAAGTYTGVTVVTVAANLDTPASATAAQANTIYAIFIQLAS